MSLSLRERRRFQSTLPRRERREPEFYGGENAKFQSTLPRRERPPRSSPTYPPDIISIHAPTQGATNSDVHLCHIQIYFNPRSHAGSDNDGPGNTGHEKISIHAPTQGATPAASAALIAKKFQSTLPRRERQKLYRDNVQAQNFNPRSHAGSDSTSPFFSQSLSISIHAPTQGATR